MVAHCEENNLDITFCKYAAGTSLTESPNDKGVMHASLHRYFRAADFRMTEICELETYDWPEVKDILHRYLDSASFNTVWKCLKHSPIFLSRAFNGHAISGALRDAGIVQHNGTFSEKIILRQCPHYNNLSQERKDYLLSKLPLFYEIFNENGYIPEAEYDRIFHENPEVDNSPERKGMQLNDMVTNLQIIGKNLLQQHQQLRQENVIQPTQTHRQKKENSVTVEY